MICPACASEIQLNAPCRQCGFFVSTSGSAGHAVSAPINSGPGTELLAIIPEFFARKEGCGCKSYAAKMDRWGVAGCEARFDEIVSHLVAKAAEGRILRFFGPINRIVAAQWVRSAIDGARAKVPPHEKLSAVWVYWAGGADGDELRYSIRSATKNLADLKNVAICGDIPDWFTGDSIHSPKWTKRDNMREFRTRKWAKWIDSIVKLRRIIDDDRITDRFLWMYDDTFIVRPTSIADLETPCVGGTLRTNERGNLWRAARRRTAQALADRGLPRRDYSTHYPLVFTKSKLLQTIEEFECDTRPRVIESLYGNQHATRTRPTAGVFHYRRSPGPGWTIPTDVDVINVGGFNRHVASVITPMFPDPSPYERESHRAAA